MNTHVVSSVAKQGGLFIIDQGNLRSVAQQATHCVRMPLDENNIKRTKNKTKPKIEWHNVQDILSGFFSLRFWIPFGKILT